MSLSKSFDVAMKGVCCTDLYHPGKTCWESVLVNVKSVYPACAAYFVPLVFVIIFILFFLIF